MSNYKRTPRGYDGDRVTSHHLQTLLPEVLKRLSDLHQMRPDLIVEAWPRIIGDRLAPMTNATHFEKGILFVKVKNSTLFSLLNQPHDKQMLLERLRQEFPKANIKTIVFRIG